MTMYDSETPSAIPADAEIVAGYVDGQWPTFDELATSHPNAKRVSITVEGAPGARVADLEVPNFNSPTIEEVAAKGAAWAKGEIVSGRRPTLYYSRGNALVVGNALAAAGVNIADVDFWVADWTGQAHMVPGSVATQWASPTTGSGGNFDISEALATWSAISGTPAPDPTPDPPPGPSGSPPAPAEPPTTQGAAFMPPVLKQGELSPSVRAAQSLLNLHNAGLKVDGDFGPATEAAVRNFQTVMHLAVDGIIGNATWTALDTFG